MATSSTMYKAVAIFVGVHLIICIKSDPTCKTLETTEESLPRVYSQDLHKLLSPEIFTQADPFHYLLEKGVKLSYYRLESTILDLNRGLGISVKGERFPTAYLPYANLLSWLLEFIFRLHSVTLVIIEVQNPKAINSLSSQQDSPQPNNHFLPEVEISMFDPELRPLYSLDIFTDPNPPSVLVDKLIHTPGDSFLRVARKLSTAKTDLFAKDFRDWYSVELSRFLMSPQSCSVLRHLQRHVARMQLLVSSSTTNLKE